MRWVEGGKVCTVAAATEACYIAVDGHSGAAGGVGGYAFPVGADGDILRIAAAYYTYGSAHSGRLEVELYTLTVFDGKGDIAVHIRLGVWCAADVCTRSSGYVGVVFAVLYLPVFGGGVRLVGGNDSSMV